MRLEQLARRDHLAQLVRELRQRVGLGVDAQRDVRLDLPDAVDARAQKRHGALVTDDDAVLTLREMNRLEPLDGQRLQHEGRCRERQLVGVPADHLVTLPERVPTRSECLLGLTVAHEDRALVHVEMEMLEHDKPLSKVGKQRWPPSGTASAPWPARWCANERLRVVSVLPECAPRWITRARARARCWRPNGRDQRRSESDETWLASAFRAITDDDLLRFFAVCETAGMLG